MRRILQVLGQIKAQALGVVLNGLSAGGYLGYGYGDGYAYQPQA